MLVVVWGTAASTELQAIVRRKLALSERGCASEFLWATEPKGMKNNRKSF